MKRWRMEVKKILELRLVCVLLDIVKPGSNNFGWARGLVAEVSANGETDGGDNVRIPCTRD
jgi:hypothetical protein